MPIQPLSFATCFEVNLTDVIHDMSDIYCNK
ncbi:hypothetical protein DN31_479 [Vibrio mimicus]|nr:hypothetical protein DN31_479 [Vibrio mimicus]